MKKQETNAAELMLQQAHDLLDSAEAIAKENAKLKEENGEILADLYSKNDKCSNLQAENNKYFAQLNNLKQVNENMVAELKNKDNDVANAVRQAEENKQKEIDDLRAELAATKQELKRKQDTLSKEPNFGWCWYKVGDGTPLDQEQVLVRTKDGVVYLKTYTPECGFRAEEAMWMSIPEYNDTPKAPKQGDKLPQVGSTSQEDEIFTRCVETFADEVISYNDEQKMEECLVHLRTITNGLREMAVAAGRDLKNITDNRLLRECYNLVDAELHYATEWADKHYALLPQQHPYLFWCVKGDIPLEERKPQHLAQLFVKDQVHHIDNIEELV